ncbi:L-seryl-tRNA(Sec) selenium transferase [Evansella cellulosilytica]|uniref:L-seryl-tRNA(Sec) selenium transferase n=1 Tax=Evansella cellulosilytica (strain ATCC 21833 / DSM 2522 / FERM P-1141 / JCM 9156 / N-4) TaxID=649639 RepID=E6U1N4_EVAC2|nr:L-seryl-tRNA(Sec) selenium transferase [Evansella cellulosilytica]ADU30397.1 L-seryl-tRNA selenium transferase [Evansella cellulosilytica DSM 2522]
MTQPIRSIPAMHEVQKTDVYKKLSNDIPTLILNNWIKASIENTRKDILNNRENYEDVSRIDHIRKITEYLIKQSNHFSPFRLQKVINGTGTVLHTNLGRARLSETAMKRVVETSANYSTLEYDVEKGERGSRHDIIQDLLLKVTNSEAAMVVNNNSAAVYFILKALCQDKEVIVSRGELVEIGGSFRVSTIMEESRAKLVEVGTTNKTHEFDYKNAITDETKMLMKVHTSNFKTVGFTKEVSSKGLKKITQQTNKEIIIYEDLGSGSLYPFQHNGIGDEPVVKEALKHADVVSFSGDKLLGGPQAGIIVGKKDIINKLKKHPLARVLRVDKMTLAALEATLQQYLFGQELQIPTIRDVLQSKDDVLSKAMTFLENLNQNSNVGGEIASDFSYVGGGTMPTEKLQTYGVILKSEHYSANQLEKKLRGGETPVITRMKDGHVFIDFRTITTEEIDVLLESVKKVCSNRDKLQ